MPNVRPATDVQHEKKLGKKVDSNPDHQEGQDHAQEYQDQAEA